MDFNKVLGMLKEQAPNFGESDTGLDWYVYISSKDGVPHSIPRLKVCVIKTKIKPEAFVSVRIDKDNPEFEHDLKKSLNDTYFKQLSTKDKEKIKSFIRINYDVLMKFWNKEIKPNELKDGLSQNKDKVEKL